MGSTNYHIRAEHKTQGGQSYCEDFQVSAEDRINAQIKAEDRIRKEKNLPFDTKFNWHGMVVFVHPPQAVTNV